MHAQQTKTHSPGPATKAAESAHKAAASAVSPTRIPAWANTWGDQPPAGLLLPGERPVPGIQTKLTINQPGDSYEQEADRVADQVMRTPASSSGQNTCACGSIAGPTGECAECAAKHKALQRKATHQASITTAPSLVTDVLNSSGGRPLDAATRSFMEPRFGQDFSNVRVHTDGQAEESAQAINARAYTVGSDVVFGARQYEPGTSEGQRLLAHELTHVVQQGERNIPGGLRIQRFSSTEHERLGKVTGVEQIDLGNGVVLAWRQLVALGDYYGTAEELFADTRTPEGKARIRAALEDYKSPIGSVTHLPAPTKPQVAEMKGRYIKLALENIPHFVTGGAVEGWARYHAEAIDIAIRAGLTKDQIGRDRAYAIEAFGEHFLSDAFSAGHIRTPRREITNWYVSNFAPAVFDRFITHLRERFVEEIFTQIQPQLPWYAPAWEVKRRIRNALIRIITQAIARAGGRAEVIRVFGLLVGGAVSGGIHDLEGGGLVVSSAAHPASWRALGDEQLAQAPQSEKEAQQAILAAKRDVDDAFRVGLLEAKGRKIAPRPTRLPERIFFRFNRDVLSEEATAALRSAGNYLIYHPEAKLSIVGHTDPVGGTAYNQGLGLRRAMAVARFLAQEGIDTSQLTISSFGETQPVTTNPREFWRNRRVNLIWREENIGVSRDLAYERARSAVQAQIGPPYMSVTRFLPTAVVGKNAPIPDWHWGNIPKELRVKISAYVVKNVGPLVNGVLSDNSLDPQVVEGHRVEPRPIAQRIINQLLSDPVLFLEGGFGRSAGPQ